MAAFAKAVLEYYQQLLPPKQLPASVGVLNPYEDAKALEVVSAFYNKFYHDTNERYICIGINPGRFGAGVTGVPFTDPIRLEEVCGITNNFEKKAELSSRFIYDMIAAFGGPTSFFSKFYVSAVSPLGFVQNGINLNYYDIADFKSLFENYAVEQIKKQLAFGVSNEVAFSIGKGQNIKFLHWINDRHQLFEKILPLSHPRWVMQYRLKRKQEFIEEYLQAFSTINNAS